jgi:hypothetical protein
MEGYEQSIQIGRIGNYKEGLEPQVLILLGKQGIHPIPPLLPILPPIPLVKLSLRVFQNLIEFCVYCGKTLLLRKKITNMFLIASVVESGFAIRMRKS